MCLLRRDPKLWPTINIAINELIVCARLSKVGFNVLVLLTEVDFAHFEVTKYHIF